MFEKSKDNSIYEEELRKIKREHFKKIAQIEDENHELRKKLKDIEADYERQILTLKQQLVMENERLKAEFDRLKIQLEGMMQAEKSSALNEVREREIQSMHRMFDTVSHMIGHRTERKIIEVKNGPAE